MQKNMLSNDQSKDERRKAFLEKIKLLGEEAIRSTNSYHKKREQKIFKLIFQDYFEKDEHTRFVRFYNFDWTNEEKHVDFLKSIIEKDECRFIKYEAVKKLLNINIKGDLALPVYITLLKNQDPRLRHYAAYAISKYCGNMDVAVKCADALTEALDDKDKFVRYRVLWAINKMSSLLRKELKEMLNKLDQMQDTESDELLKQQVKLARDVTIDGGVVWDESDLESIKVDDNKKLIEMVSNWRDLDYPARYETLKQIEEAFDSMLGRTAEFRTNETGIDVEKRKEKEKENRERAIAMEKELADAMGSGKSNLLFTALADKKDFVRYRAAGVLHRAIIRIENAKRNSMDPALLKHLDNHTILEMLKSSCAIEKEEVVRIKILESYFLGKYAVAGLTMSDNFHNASMYERLYKSIIGSKHSPKPKNTTENKGII